MFICIHPVQKDIYVSKSIKIGGIWEGHVLQVFQALLQTDPSLAVIDIGANIGQYSLLGATMGRKVVAVEARLLHVQMIHHAIVLNKLQNASFVLLNNAISNNHNVLHLQLTESYNQGHTQIVENGRGIHRGIPQSEVTDVPAILMDDLLEVIQFDKAIIKIDIEGSESKAISQCEKLLNQIYIPFMFMEWLFAKNMPVEQQLIKGILNRNGYQPYDLNKKPLLDSRIRNWPTDIIWKHDKASFTGVSNS